MEYITNQEKLEAFVQRALSSRFLAIDTEFLRERSYYPNLCLIQMATVDEVVIIDPFEINKLDVLVPLLTSDSIVKLFHAGSQDIEIFYHEFGVTPKPLFDTQIAATLLGYSQQIGYAPLVQSVCGVSLKKSDSFTDWSQRPLAPSQIEYAADDVVYLPELYDTMTKRLKQKRRLNWLDNDFDALADPRNYETDPTERWKRLKRVGQLTARQMSAAREAATWRELMAQERDMPRKWVLTDEQVVEACRREARTIDELFMVRGVRDKLSTRDARQLVARMVKGLNMPPSEWPLLDKPSKNERNVDAELDLMEALVRLRGKENDIATQTLASRSELARMARGYRNDITVLKGWRRSMVGEELLELLEGKISLSLSNGTVVVHRIDS